MKEAEREDSPPRLIAFDLDGTLLQGRVIYTLARKLGFTSELDEISSSDTPKYLRTRNIAKLLKGLPAAELSEMVEDMRLAQGAVEAVGALRDRHYTIGIISDGYTVATGVVARKLETDFQIANVLVVSEGVITGQVKMPMGWEKIGCSCEQSVCKRYHLFDQAKRYGVAPVDTVAVGDSESDACMINNAGVGIWFSAAAGNQLGRERFTIEGSDLRSVSAFLTRR